MGLDIPRPMVVSRLFDPDRPLCHWISLVGPNLLYRMGVLRHHPYYLTGLVLIGGNVRSTIVI
eukprot:14695255-Heterocapsa_arctica.AAC.1